MKTIKDLNKAWVQANTMSVLHTDDKSISISIQLGPETESGEEYTNATLRFDRGSVVEVCGYPQNWALYDEPYDQYDHDDNDLLLDVVDCKDILLDMGYTHTVNLVDEYNILNQVLAALVEQLDNPEWGGCCSLEYGLECINKIKNALYQDKYAFINKTN